MLDGHIDVDAPGGEFGEEEEAEDDEEPEVDEGPEVHQAVLRRRPVIESCREDVGDDAVVRRKQQRYRPSTTRVKSKDTIDTKELDPAEEYADALGVQAMEPPVEQIALPAFWVTQRGVTVIVRYGLTKQEIKSSRRFG